MDNEKKIFLFEQFVQNNRLNEAEGDDDLVADATGDEGGDEANADTKALVNPEDEVKDEETLPALSSVVEKKFFKELKKRIIYWFQNLEEFKDLTLESAEEETRAVVVWAFDTFDEEKGEKHPKYSYKIKYGEHLTAGDIEKVEEVILYISIYRYEDSSETVADFEKKITLKKVNGEYLISKMDTMKKRADALDMPQSEDDIEKFKNREERHLGDETYL
jgi:hypothetical protein